MLETNAKVQYICKLVCGEVLRQFDLLSDDVENTDTSLTVDYPLKGLAYYFYLRIIFQNKRVQCTYVQKQNRLKVSRYALRLIDLSEYLTSFTGATIADKIGVFELNEFTLNSMTNIWSNQAYVQGFDCEPTSLKKDVNMFECMEIAESIYEGAVIPSC